MGGFQPVQSLQPRGHGSLFAVAGHVPDIQLVAKVLHERLQVAHERLPRAGAVQEDDCVTGFQKLPANERVSPRS